MIRVLDIRTEHLRFDVSFGHGWMQLDVHAPSGGCSFKILYLKRT